MQVPPVAIVLVGPQGDANIGAAARAMKNFEVTDLRLVNPVPHLTKPAYMWAVEAKDVLTQAAVVSSLDEALQDCSCSAAFTRRTGTRRKRHLILHEAAPLFVERARAGRLALVFGREDKGLSNDEVRRCDYVVEIPTSEALPSINLAQSVILACYELAQACCGSEKRACAKREMRDEEHYVPREVRARTLTLLEGMLKHLRYSNAAPQRLRSRILRQFETIFGRAGLTPRDVGMIEGLAARVAEVVRDTTKEEN